MRPRPRLSARPIGPVDAGSATVWLLGFAALVMLVAAVAVSSTTAVLVRRHVERAADLAALAGAEQIGRGGQPCAVARQIAESNKADLDSCDVRLDVSGRSGSVSIVVSRPVRLRFAGDQRATARARAARLPADGGP